MEFCEKCSGLMLPQGDEQVCRKCGAIKKKKFEEILEYKVTSEEKKIEVFDKEEIAKKMSTIEATCPKCKHNRAMWWMQQMRSGDEPATRFYKCVKCGKTWREYN